MKDDLDQLLVNLKLRKIREILDRELKRAQTGRCSYSTFLARLLREEYLYKESQSLQSRIKRANIPEHWALESFPFKKQPGVNATQIRQLAELNFIAHAENIVFIGDTAVGKTGLATGLLLKALENGSRGLFISAQDLLDEMYASLADRSSKKLIEKLTRIDVLLIDELGYLNIKPEQSNVFFRLMEARYRRKSTIITTNLDYDAWYDFLGQKEMVKALLSRLRHYCTTIHIDGPPLREPVSSV